MIGGNKELIIQILKSTEDFDENGKRKSRYISITAPIIGWLDLISGDSNYNYKAKIEDSTHIFVCDYTVLGKIDIEKSRAVVTDVITCEEMGTCTCKEIKNFQCNEFEKKEEIYDIKYIDNPMELNQHLEIYLKFIGGQASE